MPTLACQSRCRIASLKLQHVRPHAGETNGNHRRLTRLWLNIFTSCLSLAGAARQARLPQRQHRGEAGRGVGWRLRQAD
jgi:hypothetical protein